MAVIAVSDGGEIVEDVTLLCDCEVVESFVDACLSLSAAER